MRFTKILGIPPRFMTSQIETKSNKTKKQPPKKVQLSSHLPLGPIRRSPEARPTVDIRFKRRDVSSQSIMTVI